MNTIKESNGEVKAFDYYQVNITKTSAPLFSSDYSMFDHETKTFATLNEAQAFLREQYGTCKRDAMYVDTKNGESKRVGTVYKFRNADWSHAPVQKWNQADWIEVVGINSQRILV